MEPNLPERVSDFQGFRGVPLLAGDAGINQTMQLIRVLIDEGVKDPEVNRFAIAIVKQVPEYDQMAEVQALYDAVRRTVRYVMDPIGPLGPKEGVRPARVILQDGAGDCDDINGVLIPTLLGTVGYPSRLITIAADPSDPKEMSHIYAEANVPVGSKTWIPMDAARPGARFGEAPPFYFRKEVWNLSDSGHHAVDGCRKCHSLAGYAVLGQDSTANVLPQDVTAISSGVAEVIAAARRQPFDPYAYPQQPFSSFQTPYSPAAIAAGQGYQTGTLALTGQGSTMLTFLGIGLVALLLYSKFRN